MILEEAAEILLENRPWVPCTECQGSGLLRKPTLEVGDPVSLNPDGTVYSVRPCGVCEMTGGVVSQRYKEACHVLGITNQTVWVPITNTPMHVGIVTRVSPGLCDIQRSIPDLQGNPLPMSTQIIRMKHSP